MYIHAHTHTHTYIHEYGKFITSITNTKIDADPKLVHENMYTHTHHHTTHTHTHTRTHTHTHTHTYYSHTNAYIHTHTYIHKCCRIITSVTNTKVEADRMLVYENLKKKITGILDPITSVSTATHCIALQRVSTHCKTLHSRFSQLC